MSIKCECLLDKVLTSLLPALSQGSALQKKYIDHVGISSSTQPNIFNQISPQRPICKASSNKLQHFAAFHSVNYRRSLSPGHEWGTLPISSKSNSMSGLTSQFFFWSQIHRCRRMLTYPMLCYNFFPRCMAFEPVPELWRFLPLVPTWSVTWRSWKRWVCLGASDRVHA